MNMNKGLSISIITTSLNRRNLLKKTLESVLEQSCENVEQVVLDGASTDGTAELLKSFEGHFKKRGYRFSWISEKDSGQSEAMNKGLKKAMGDFIMILNSDDYLEPASLSGFMEELARRPEIDLIYGNHGQIFENGTYRVISHKLYNLHDVVSRGYQIPQSAAIFRRALLDKTGGFNTSLRHVAEHDLFVRMMKSGVRVFYLPRILQTTLEHSGRKTVTSGASAWEETKRVNFSHGAGYFSRFYFLYVKEVYFGGFFRFLAKKAPWLHRALKRLFYFVSH